MDWWPSLLMEQKQCFDHGIHRINVCMAWVTPWARLLALESPVASTCCWMTKSQSRQDPGMLEVDDPTCTCIRWYSHHNIIFIFCIIQYIYRMSAVCKNKYIYIWKDSRQSVVSAVAVCAFCLLGSDLLSLQAITPGYRSRLKAYWTRMPCWHNKMYSCITVVPHKGVLYLTHTHIYIHTLQYITLHYN